MKLPVDLEKGQSYKLNKSKVCWVVLLVPRVELCNRLARSHMLMGDTCSAKLNRLCRFNITEKEKFCDIAVKSRLSNNSLTASARHDVQRQPVPLVGLMYFLRQSVASMANGKLMKCQILL